MVGLFYVNLSRQSLPSCDILRTYKYLMALSHVYQGRPVTCLLLVKYEEQCCASVWVRPNRFTSSGMLSKVLWLKPLPSLYSSEPNHQQLSVSHVQPVQSMYLSHQPFLRAVRSSFRIHLYSV